MNSQVNELFDLAGQRALVTGAGGGLGRAMADALQQAGASVAVVGRGDSIMGLAGDGFIPIQGDLTQVGAPDRLVAEARANLGGLDILVAAHGVARRSAAEDFPDEDWNATVGTNLTSVFQTARAAGRMFLEQGSGKVINVASMLSFSGGLMACAYAASKGGIAQLTKALANEWAGRGINVNAIAPGYFATSMTEALRKDKARNQQILDRLPAGRWGGPADLAGAVIFLASAASDYVHGIILPVDGGWLAR